MPLHRFFLPWQYYYDRALAWPHPPSPAHPWRVCTRARTPPPAYPASITYPAPKGLASLRKELHSLPGCAGEYQRLSGVWSSQGFAAASDLSDGTGSFFSIDKRQHLLAGKGATLTDRRYLLAEKGGISAQESPFC